MMGQTTVFIVRACPCGLALAALLGRINVQVITCNPNARIPAHEYRSLSVERDTEICEDSRVMASTQMLYEYHNRQTLERALENVWARALAF
jgi:hypothetical protein